MKKMHKKMKTPHFPAQMCSRSADSFKFHGLVERVHSQLSG